MSVALPSTADQNAHQSGVLQLTSLSCLVTAFSHRDHKRTGLVPPVNYQLELLLL